MKTLIRKIDEVDRKDATSSRLSQELINLAVELWPPNSVYTEVRRTLTVKWPHILYCRHTLLCARFPTVLLYDLKNISRFFKISHKTMWSFNLSKLQAFLIRWFDISLTYLGHCDLERSPMHQNKTMAACWSVYSLDSRIYISNNRVSVAKSSCFAEVL